MTLYDGFGRLDDGRPFWTGDFTGDGRRDMLFYYPGDRNWWLGRCDAAGKLTWNLAGNTAGFGQVHDGRPFWVGDFAGDGKSDMIELYRGGTVVIQVIDADYDGRANVVREYDSSGALSRETRL